MPDDDWTDDLLKGPPERPQHPDFMKLSEIVLRHDGPTSDPTAERLDLDAKLTEYIDPETLTYMAMQRSMMFMAMVGITSTPQMVAAMSSVYLDAFLVGIEWERKRTAG